MAAKRDTRGVAPSHPGAYIRQDILPALAMTITDLAKHLAVSRTALSELVNERRGVSLEMAQRLGQAFGNGARFWMALQMQHDIWTAERSSRINIERLRWKATEAA